MQHVLAHLACSEYPDSVHWHHYVSQDRRPGLELPCWWLGGKTRLQAAAAQKGGLWMTPPASALAAARSLAGVVEPDPSSASASSAPVVQPSSAAAASSAQPSSVAAASSAEPARPSRMVEIKQEQRVVRPSSAPPALLLAVREEEPSSPEPSSSPSPETPAAMPAGTAVDLAAALAKQQGLFGVRNPCTDIRTRDDYDPSRDPSRPRPAPAPKKRPGTTGTARGSVAQDRTATAETTAVVVTASSVADLIYAMLVWCQWRQLLQ